MGAWCDVSDTDFSWEPAVNAWRCAAEGFYLASTSGTPAWSRPLGGGRSGADASLPWYVSAGRGAGKTTGIATFPEYLEAMTRAFHAEIFATTGERPDPSLELVARTGSRVIGPAGPVSDLAVGPMREFFREIGDAWRDPHGVPRRAPFVSEVLYELEFGTQCFFRERPWLSAEAATASLSLEPAPEASAERSPVRWEEDPPAEVQAYYAAHPTMPPSIEDHPKGRVSIAKYLPEHEEGEPLTVSELVTLALSAASTEIRSLAVQGIPDALESCTEDQLPRGDGVAALQRVVAGAELPTRAQIASQVPDLLALNDFEMEEWRSLLEQLAADPEPLVRARFAYYCRELDEAVLPADDPLRDRLGADAHPLVVAAWTLNEFDLWTLAWHADWGVRYFVATRGCLRDAARVGAVGVEALVALASQGPALRGFVVDAESLPHEVIMRLAADEDAKVRAALARRRSWTGLEAALELLAADTDRDVRLSLCQNEHLPVALLERLSTDTNVGRLPDKAAELLRRLALKTLAKVQGRRAPH